MNGLLGAVAQNAIFVVEFLGIVVLLFLVGYFFEKYQNKKNNVTERILSTRKVAMIGMLSAVATVLMLLEFPVPFAPPFYKMDLSELPVLIGSFAFGPVTGVMVEFCKIILKLLFKSTSTAFVGELANFSVGCSFILPASILYYLKKDKKHALVGCLVGTLIMTIFGTSFNGIYLLPKFAELFGMPLEAIIGMGTAINSNIVSVTSFVCLAVAPLNLIKGTTVSIITLLIYKKISPILKEGHRS
ncbi:MAG: ECF transporter S component [Lachnospiraceae bacterium]|nr:ECF transporter S component [Lachnospiraceae bacterium]